MGITLRVGHESSQRMVRLVVLHLESMGASGHRFGLLGFLLGQWRGDDLDCGRGRGAAANGNSAMRRNIRLRRIVRSPEIYYEVGYTHIDR